MPSHGGNISSSSVGRANKINHLAESLATVAVVVSDCLTMSKVEFFVSKAKQASSTSEVSRPFAVGA